MPARPAFLGVNVDHVATVRQARGTPYPDPVDLARQAEDAGADGITMHLREDRRHIHDADVRRMAHETRSKLNLEMAATAEMRAIALQLRPVDACIVPERRAEVTTEGGLDVAANRAAIAELVAALGAAGIRVSLFIDPDHRQIDAAVAAGAPVVELHTGGYANATDNAQRRELDTLAAAAAHAAAAGLVVNAGHGLHYTNTQAVAALPQIHELNIGHAIVARALAVGMAGAVREMKQLLAAARG